MALFIFNADCSRFKKGIWNWEQAPINTIHSGFVAYDLPGSAGAKIQWQSGHNRGGKLDKNGSVPPLIYLLLH